MKTMVRDLVLPRTRAAWATFALVSAIFVASSAAPFVQFGGSSIRLGLGDLASASVYLVTWVPFVAGAAWLVLRGPGGSAAIAVQLALVALCPAAHSATFLAVPALRSGELPSLVQLLSAPAFLVLTILGTLQFLVLVTVSVAVAAGRAADRDRVRAAELESQLAQARIAALTAQLRPHFLFNALNSIAVLTQVDPAAAETMVRRLSALLRAALSAGEEATVALSSELELLDAYVSIQRVRFRDRLDVRMDIDVAARECEVPTLILQPLVENAIEHAVAAHGKGAIEVSARRTGGRLQLTVADSGIAGPGDRPAGAPVRAEGMGIGHENTRRRLAALYGPQHSFAVQFDGGGYVVRVDIPAVPRARAT